MHGMLPSIHKVSPTLISVTATAVVAIHMGDGYRNTHYLIEQTEGPNVVLVLTYTCFCRAGTNAIIFHNLND